MVGKKARPDKKLKLKRETIKDLDSKGSAARIKGGASRDNYCVVAPIKIGTNITVTGFLCNVGTGGIG